jgi:hypothetical protein
MRRTVKQTAAVTEAYQCSYQLDAKFIRYSSFRLTHCVEGIIGDLQFGCRRGTGSAVFIQHALLKCFRKMGIKWIYISEGRCDSFGREVLCNIVCVMLFVVP